MTKLEASLLYVAAFSVCKAAQYCARRQVQRGRLGQRSLKVLDYILGGFMLSLTIFLGMTTFADWLALIPGPVDTGIFVLTVLVGILYACPRRAALLPLLGFGIALTLFTLQPWILQRLIPRAGLWPGIAVELTLMLIEICLCVFVSYRMLRGLLLGPGK